MKNIKKIISTVIFTLTLVSMFTLGGCEKGIEDSPTSLSAYKTGVLYLLQDPKNQQIKNEVDWLYSKGRISLEEYSDYMVNGIYFGSSDVDYQVYIIGGDVGYSREQIQQEMKLDRAARHRKRSIIYNYLIDIKNSV